MTQTKNNYQQNIIRVLDYINDNLHEAIDLDKLASIANYSPYHFHRLVSAYLKEPLGTYVNRLRLERAVFRLRCTDDDIRTICFKVGFNDQSSFARAFKQRYGVSATHFRKSNMFLFPSFYINTLKMKKENLTETPEMRVFPKTEVVAVRAIGPYHESATAAWNELNPFAGSRQLFGPNTKVIGIGYDDPSITEPDKCRYDACISIDKDVEVSGNVVKKTLEEGNYAVFTHKGAYEHLKEAYHQIFSGWAKDNMDKLDEKPPMEMYLNCPSQVAPEELLTEIWIPLK